jgi:enoyl-CoA hydratase/carnithine racemase
MNSILLEQILGPQLGFEIVRPSGKTRKSLPQPIRVLIDEAGLLRDGDLEACDIALTSAKNAPRPWVSVDAGSIEREAARLRDCVARSPIASHVARDVFATNLEIRFDAALSLESQAYSMLLSGSEFAAWRRETPVKPARESSDSLVNLDFENGHWLIELNRPTKRNAFNAKMRDGLVAALESVAEDANALPVLLRGAGLNFCSGGDLSEFGTAGDPSLAHLVRLHQSPARLARSLGSRLKVFLHGACIGAGIEIPAAAQHVAAAQDVRISLPEVHMGLIPGAGGSVSIPGRIGRHRALYLALSGHVLDARTALDWGLIDEVVPDLSD